MELKAIPKPEAYELNSARMTRDQDASKWLPEDALYSAYERLMEAKARGYTPKALVIAWSEEDGTFNRNMYTETQNDGTALLTRLFFSARDG